MEFKLNQSENIIFLAYTCFACDSTKRKPPHHFLNISNEFYKNPDFDTTHYFNLYNRLIKTDNFEILLRKAT